MYEYLKSAVVQQVLCSRIMCKSEEVDFPFAERNLHWPISADFISSQVTSTKVTALSSGSFTSYVRFIVADF
jgi:hypothetical protein